MAGSTENPETEILSRDIPAAIADAILEHESWLATWQRTMLCGLPPRDELTVVNSHETCRFGRWYARNAAAGLLDGTLFEDLGRMHREVHDAARRLMDKVKGGRSMEADEYDAMMDAADKFRKIAIRIQELHGRPDDGTVPGDDDLAELQSRLTMLSELEREWERAARTGRPACLIMVRPNGLVEIAKTYGQVGIDRIVAGLAARLFSHLRPYDSVFRYGRAGFIVCVPDSDPARVETVGDRLDHVIAENPIALSETVELPVSACFGIALLGPNCTVQEVLDRASRATNMAGSAEGQRVVTWSADLEN